MIKLGNKQLQVPIIQGGMGVGISLGNLCGHVMRANAMGVISCAHPGYREADFVNDSLAANLKGLKNEMIKAREISQGLGLLAVNIMYASKDYAEYVKAACDNKVDAIISGAGLPLDLPKYVNDQDILLAPIVSSGKACNLIAKRWDKSYGRIMDFVVIEGWQAGGHLGFKPEELLSNKCLSLEEILQEVIEVLKPYEEKYQRKIPIFVAGGIYDGKDMAKYIKLGASGVQIGTRFIATYECDADIRFKQAIIECSQADIGYVKSPTGLLGRAIKNRFVQNLDDKLVSVKHCYHCLKTCDPNATCYCISKALINAVKGNVDAGLIFVGSNAYKVDRLYHVDELIEEIMQEYKQNIGEK